MGLLIRVRHLLGNRVIELPDRSAERPIVLGRALTADVQIPSVSVGLQHAWLFCDGDRWVVRPAVPNSVSVNNLPIREAAYLHDGDVVQIGPDGRDATIEIEPEKSVSGGARLADPAAPMSEPYTPLSGVPIPRVASSLYPQSAMAPSGAAYGGAAFGGPAYGGPTASAEPSYTPPIDAPADRRPAVGFSRSPRLRRRRTHPLAIFFASLFSALLMGGLIWLVSYRYRQAQAALHPPATSPAGTSTAGTSVFDSNPATNPAESGATSPGPAPPSPQTQPLSPTQNLPPFDRTTFSDAVPAKESPDRPAAGSPTITPPTDSGIDMVRESPAKQPATTPAAAASLDPAPPPSPSVAGSPSQPPPSDPPPLDPGPATAASSTPDVIAAASQPAFDPETLDAAAAQSWEIMQQLAETRGKEGFAVYWLDRYRKANLNQHAPEIEAYIDRKFDRIWWERVDGLVRDLARLESEIKKDRLALFDANDPKQKKQLLDAVTKMTADQKTATDTLRNKMGFADAAAPDLTDEAALSSAAAKRDRNKYQSWKAATLLAIRNGKGRLPWQPASAQPATMPTPPAARTSASPA